MADKYSRGQTIAEILRSDLAEAQKAGASEDDISMAIECIIVQALRIRKTHIERVMVAGRFAEYICRCMSDPDIERWKAD